MSARQALYLSYQGKNIRNNKDRQPSLVLKELMEYLARGYGWQLLGLNAEAESNRLGQVRQLPMQAFSEKNYLDSFASFDANWLLGMSLCLQLYGLLMPQFLLML